MEKSVYLIRHAHSQSLVKENYKLWRNRKLSQLGIKQSNDLAVALMEEKIDLIISSSFLRSVNTAKIVAKCLNLPTRIESCFDERTVSYNRNKSYLTEAWKRSLCNWDYLPDKSGESLNTATDRFINGLDKLIIHEVFTKAAIISHERILRYSLFKLFGNYDSHIQYKEIDYCSPFIIQNKNNQLLLVKIGNWMRR